MTLILKVDLNMVKMYLYTKNEVSMSRGSKVIARRDINTKTDRQTHRQTDGHDRKHYLPAYIDMIFFEHTHVSDNYCL